MFQLVPGRRATRTARASSDALSRPCSTSARSARPRQVMNLASVGREAAWYARTHPRDADPATYPFADAAAAVDALTVVRTHAAGAPAGCPAGNDLPHGYYRPPDRDRARRARRATPGWLGARPGLPAAAGLPGDAASMPWTDVPRRPATSAAAGR